MKIEQRKWDMEELFDLEKQTQTGGLAAFGVVRRFQGHGGGVRLLTAPWNVLLGWLVAIADRVGLPLGRLIGCGRVSSKNT
ncbi:hypothetical protein HN588_02995 [Candidatus Bathyarchaeota archaeon]|nr:hypothetical protein [Candidatus Bathyarchaeota archaeon]